MKKACFIVPYFGQFPNYFQLFLRSCSINKDYQWLIITDNKEKYSYPKNVKKIDMSFQQLREKFQDKFDFSICLNTPRKLCDYKPAYGYIFEDYIHDYPYWGHCDIDTIIGKLNDFLPELISKKYDKIFTLGHFVLYKNTFENNRIFMKQFQGRKLYKESFTTDKITVFDETYGNKNNVNSIFISNKKEVFQEDYSYNIYINRTTFQQIKYLYKTNTYILGEKLKYNIFVWSSNGLSQIKMCNNKVVNTKIMYLHLQQRKMRIKKDISKYYDFVIIPNLFYGIEKVPKNISEYKKLKKGNFSFHKERIFIKWKIYGLKKRLIKKSRRL